MAGKERNHILAGLNLDGCNVIGRNDFCADNRVFERFPKICNHNFVSNSQIGDITEIVCTVPPAVSGNHTVCIGAADRYACLPQHCGTKRHILTGRSQIDGHFQLERWNGQNAKSFTFQAVARKGEVGFLQCTKPAYALLTSLIKLMVVAGYVFS